MPTKIFTTITGPCPFGKNVTIDSLGCRSCEHFYRTGTATFFWCSHPIEQKPDEIAQKATEIAQPAKKRGRPAGKAKKKPVKTRKKKNG